MSREDYIKEILLSHLTNEKNYKIIPKEEHKNLIQTRETKFKNLYYKYKDTLPKEEKQYFERSFERSKPFNVAGFYGLPKIHKSKNKTTNIHPLRPVVGIVDTIDAIFANYIDYKLKPIMQKHLPPYLKNSDDLREQLKYLQKKGLLDSDLLFSLDAIGMYPNIDTKDGLKTIKEWLLDPTIVYLNLSTEFLLEALYLCMTEKLFYFGDLLFLQINDTAIDTLCAVVYANLYTGRKEKTLIIKKYAHQLSFFKRFINDIIEI